MRYLVVGGGGREHAIVHALSKNVSKENLFCAPGNAGTEALATNVEIKASQIRALVEFVQLKDIDLTIVGPEAPLVDGLCDLLRKNGRKVLGPTALAARLEGSKIFSKQFMRRHNIPTADFWHFNQYSEILRFLDIAKFPLVLKADGLASGKGVVICKNADEAKKVAHDFMENRKFGEASEQILIENFLDGVETSVFCLTDGRTIMILPTACDYKRAYDGDAGPNTGGMGAVSPSPRLTDDDLALIEKKIIVPVIHGMQMEESPYTGFLYIGLMLTKTGPRVLEFNVRLGDPEAQVILPRLKSSLADLCLAAVDGTLEESQPEWDDRAAVAVVLASEGYPEDPKKGRAITGATLPPSENHFLYHAGTKRSAGKLVTDGGRIFAMTGLGKTINDARSEAYKALKNVQFDGMQYREDIAHFD
ncbi:MAG: phosphoribosylamine--glycine ligase [Planctomycetota bacterium]|nr:phosphoribosylamine--glycine ligase [Planctomycetota bacterium]